MANKVTANLRKLLEDNKANHEKTQRALESERRNNDIAYQNAEMASQSRLDALRRSTQETISAMEKGFDNDRQAHEKKIAQKEKDHEEYMLKQRNASQAERMASEEAHRKSVEELKKSFEGEKTRAAMQLEQIKKNGQTDIKKVEKEMEDLQKKRNDDLESFNAQMKQLMEKSHRDRSEEGKLRLKLQMEDLNAESERMADVHKAKMLEIAKDKLKLKNAEVSSASLIAIQKLSDSIELISDTTGFLEEIKDTCEDKDTNYSVDEIDLVGYNAKSIEAVRATFDNKMKALKNFLIVQYNLDPEIVSTCMSMLNNMKKHMESSEIRAVCTKLPEFVGQQNHGRIAGILSKMMSLTKNLQAIYEKAEIYSVSYKALADASKLAIEDK